jgi:hypothetical protein
VQYLDTAVVADGDVPVEETETGRRAVIDSFTLTSAPTGTPPSSPRPIAQSPANRSRPPIAYPHHRKLGSPKSLQRPVDGARGCDISERRRLGRARRGSTPGVCRGRRLGGLLIRHERRRFTTGIAVQRSER